MIITTRDCKKHELKPGITISEMFALPDFDTPPFTIAAKKNYNLVSLATNVTEDARITPVTMQTIEGRRIYQKSISLVLLKAFYDLFPGKRIKIQHSISKSVYCTPLLGREVTQQDVDNLNKRMAEITAAKIPFEEEEMDRAEALKYFSSINLPDKVELIHHLSSDTIKLTKLHLIRDLWYYPMVEHTGIVDKFEVRLYPPGILLRFPRTADPAHIPPFKEQKKLFTIFSEDAKWSNILEVTNVGQLNQHIANKEISEIIKIAESLHEKKIAQIADEIAQKKEQIKFILIAGPSSSGKTTFCKRLGIQLRVNGIKTASISTDNYFKPRELTPRLENGDYNFEDLGALDLDLFNEHLSRILNGKEIEVPKFDFASGSRLTTGTPTTIPEDMPVIIEGIHCLNEKLTNAVPRENKFLIYVSALTQLNIDDFNRIPTTDNRLLRRIVRDSYFRGYSAYETLNRWDSVRAGEDKNIFPFQEQTDTMFNSALIYELAVLKKFALPLLKQVPPTVPEYSEAQRLMKFLMSFLSIETSEIPPTSILREFVGNSSFHY